MSRKAGQPRCPHCNAELTGEEIRGHVRIETAAYREADSGPGRRGLRGGVGRFDGQALRASRGGRASRANGQAREALGVRLRLRRPRHADDEEFDARAVPILRLSAQSTNSAARLTNRHNRAVLLRIQTAERPAGNVTGSSGTISPAISPYGRFDAPDGAAAENER